MSFIKILIIVLWRITPIISVCASNEYYDTDAAMCKSCDFRCTACSGPDYTQCTSCSLGFFFEPPNSCVNFCGTPYYSDYSDYLCKNCYTGCLDCNGLNFNDCTRCDFGLKLSLQGECIVVCPD